MKFSIPVYNFQVSFPFQTTYSNIQFSIQFPFSYSNFQFQFPISNSNFHFGLLIPICSGLDRDEMESVENISTVTVDDDDLVSLHLVLTPTQDSQGQGQPGISTPPVLPLTPAAAPDSRTPILQGRGPAVAPGPVRDHQPRASVQLGGTGAPPRRAALQTAAHQGAGFTDRHPVPHHLPPSPQAEVHPNSSPS